MISLKRCLLTLTIVVCLLIAGVAIYIWFGFYNVGATVPHWGITHWFLEEVREQSISVHSKEITVPPLKDPKLFDIGFKNYHAMCRLCHGTPGNPRSEIAKGLYPIPPDFSQKDIKWGSDAELYWVIKNGIKMTGMPSFGPTHSEEEIWGIVAFVKGLPSLKHEEYRSMVKAAGMDKEKEDHH